LNTSLQFYFTSTCEISYGSGNRTLKHVLQSSTP